VENILVIRPNGTINSEQARGLLRRFRDLNLGSCGIDVGENARVTVAGCLSVDHPVENGVRYRLREDAGAERVLAIHWEGDHLVLRLGSGDAPESLVQGELDVELGCDGQGRVAAPALGARLDLESAGPLEIEHFLRRIVRAVYSRAS
jgi:hypothetical protein